VSDLRTDERAEPAPATTRPGRVGWVLTRLRDTSVQLIAGQLLAGVIALIANILMARALSPTGRGEVALMLQIVYLSTQVLLLGTERSFVAGYHGTAPAAAVKAYARLLIVPCAIGLFVVAGFVLLAPERYDPGPGFVAVVACYAVVDAGILATRAVAVAVGRVHDFLRARVIESVSVLAMMLALYFTRVADPAIWVLVYLIAGLLPTTAYIVFWLRLPAPATTTPIAPGQQRQARREGLLLFPAAIANMAMLRVDRLALPVLASTAELGLYASVSTLTELLVWPLRAYADSRLGKWRAAHKGGALQVRPLVLAAIVYTVVVAPIAAAGIYWLIVPVFGARYAPARAVVLPLVVAAGLYAVSRITLGLLIAKGHSALVSGAEIFGFAVSLVAYLALIPKYGIQGAAWGSLIGYGGCLLFAVAASRFAGERLPAAAPPEAVETA
jgi:O-antigen/teichoic acid export membrane protein